VDNLSLILLAGGSGSRMGSPTPKQFLPLQGKPIALHSFEIFRQAGIEEIVIVCALEYRHLFDHDHFALPGKERYDSVRNGLELCTKEWICVHDSARPFIDLAMIDRVYCAAQKTGAATLGMPMISTVKESCEKGIVKRTLDRSLIWEIQTPQVVRKDILWEGFAKGVAVTDDVSLAEVAGYPVQIVEGSRSNLKITTQEDLIIARRLCEI